MFLILILFCGLTIVYSFYGLLVKNHQYWKKRRVPHLKPLPLFGNYKDYILLRKCLSLVTQEICKQFPNEPYIGVFYGTKPAIIIQDPDIIKLVTTKDFYYFSGREVTSYANREIMTQSLLFTGGDQWNVLRQNLAPFFSSIKMMNMFPVINDRAKAFESLLEREFKASPSVEVTMLIARYTIDCISICAFGLDPDTMSKSEDSNPCLFMSGRLLEGSNIRGIKTIARSMWPELFYGLKLKLFDKEIFQYFYTLIKGISHNRKHSDGVKIDFIDQILDWEKNAYITGDRISNLKTGDRNKIRLEANEELLVAQSLLFFAGGFETVSTTLSYLMYELAKRADIQARLIEEVDAYFEKHNGLIEYECINEMPYLQSCIDESLRIYPVLGVLTREVMDDYTLPTGLRLNKGMHVHIPVYHIHHDSNNYPMPEEFRPERFLEPEKSKINPFTHITFGKGPRTCIGQRFSRMPMYAAMLTIFKNYYIELAESMPRRVDFVPTSFVLHPIGGINLKFIPRSSQGK